MTEAEEVIAVLKTVADKNPTPPPIELTMPEINKMLSLAHPSGKEFINNLFQVARCHKDTGNKKKLRRYVNDCMSEVDIFKIKQYLHDNLS